jgi:four helix bundle suffix protein
MVQAARSGRQNIAEGSRAAATSSQTELRSIGVARASLDELLLDYEDFLRQRGLRLWGNDSPEARAVRAVGHRSDRTDRSDRAAYAAWLDHGDPAVVANTLICLIHQANYLLDQQLSALERAFVHDGGYSERLAAARLRNRSSEPATACPLCGQPMGRANRTTRPASWLAVLGMRALPGVQGRAPHLIGRIRPIGPITPPPRACGRS